MIRLNRVIFFVLLAVTVALGGWFTSQDVFAQTPQPQTSEEQALKSLAAFQPIDVHVHVFKTDAAFQGMLERLHLMLINILVMDDTLSYRKQLQPQIDDALKLVRFS